VRAADVLRRTRVGTAVTAASSEGPLKCEIDVNGAYAERMHSGQRLGDGQPFILHPLEVASLLYYAAAPDHLIAAGVMHELREKTSASPAGLREHLGRGSPVWRSP
jgi:(p)ppGpp synthase/HD superfamily hydrolase